MRSTSSGVRSWASEKFVPADARNGGEMVRERLWISLTPVGIWWDLPKVESFEQGARMEVVAEVRIAHPAD